MNGRAYKEELLSALREALGSGDLEIIKRVAETFHNAGGDPVAAISSIVLNELPDGNQRTLALRALESLDALAAKSVAKRLHVSLGTGESQSEVPAAQAKAPPSAPSKWLIFGPLIALAILWPAYSVYRFNHPRPSEPPKPKPPWDDQEVKFESTHLCQAALRQRLRDPDSAEFSSWAEPKVGISHSDVEVKGYLHANNGLGLKVRVDYFCALQVDRQAHKLSILDARLIQR